MTDIDDEELKELIRSGAKILSRTSAPAPEPEPPTDMAQIIASINGVVDSLTALAARPSPGVSVSAPQVSVKPQITVEPRREPKEYIVEVVERDKSADQRIKKLSIKPIY